MNAQEITEAFAKIQRAIERDDDKMPKEIFQLAAQVIIDINRIADAIEHAARIHTGYKPS